MDPESGSKNPVSGDPDRHQNLINWFLATHPTSYDVVRSVNEPLILHSVVFTTMHHPHSQSLPGASKNLRKITTSKFITEQVGKVLWTRKAPACLLTLLYDYGKLRLCINIHHYAPPHTVLQQVASVHAALHALYIAQYREHLIR